MWFFWFCLPREKILPSRKKIWPSVRKKRFKIKQAFVRKISGRDKNEPSWDFQNRCKKAWFFWQGLKNKRQKYISNIFEKRPVKTAWYLDPHYLWNLTPLKRPASQKHTAKNPESLCTTTTTRFWHVWVFGLVVTHDVTICYYFISTWHPSVSVDKCQKRPRMSSQSLSLNLCQNGCGVHESSHGSCKTLYRPTLIDLIKLIYVGI